MILVAIIALSTVVLVLLFSFFESFPTVPTTFMVYIRMYMPYVVRGLKFVNGFINVGVVLPLALVCVALHAFWTGYRIFMWVMKKVPMFGVSD